MKIKVLENLHFPRELNGFLIFNDFSVILLMSPLMILTIIIFELQCNEMRPHAEDLISSVNHSAVVAAQMVTARCYVIFHEEYIHSKCGRF